MKRFILVMATFCFGCATVAAQSPTEIPVNQEQTLEELQQQILDEKDPVKSSLLQMQAALSCLREKDYRQAAAYAQNSIGLSPDNPTAYYLLAQACIFGSANACSGFGRQTLFWLITDYLEKAKAYASDNPEMLKNIDQLIENCKAGFPGVEELFMRDLVPGQSYTVDCGWIKGTTTVRNPEP